ncbi:GntR family transcriptional regulator [Actinoalloteichus hoggarensis]|uniref:HTH-type transcriptional repressor YvoA n=1 Tax=Actinoalloteichus hoggarensis TaxID=1470176 RepID=A0A221W6P1_9PSEU|nr:GntR family transcriptional regulator [Actinoalloteichus hoggarensis]ASO21535.1 HTH-type transcriptional repressor YvoA [Actinoalloteichus hoggarensis]MBB5922126.1 GntR family transcriptional regulator [Actinoalloteichus hoggarensis]
MSKIQRHVPEYLQISTAIRERIERGDLAPGEEVPSVRAIAAEWEVSAATAQRVLGALRDAGLVETRPGRSSVVRHPTAGGPRQRFETMSRTGRIYAPGEYARIVSAEVVGAPEQVRDALSLGTRQAIRRVRVRYNASDEPVSASTSWFDADLSDVAPALLVADRITMGTPAYIASTTGRVLRSASDRYTARAATSEDAAALGCKLGEPVMAAENIIYDQNGLPVEFGESVVLAGRWSSYYSYQF